MTDKEENKYFTEKKMALCLILAILFGTIAIYCFSPEPNKIKQRIQNQCYEKVFNDDAFWILKVMQNANKTFIYCDNEWGHCVCKFYWGHGIVIYKDEFYAWEMPNLKEVLKEENGTGTGKG
jgi:hypothetical protein